MLRTRHCVDPVFVLPRENATNQFKIQRGFDLHFISHLIFSSSVLISAYSLTCVWLGWSVWVFGWLGWLGGVLGFFGAWRGKTYQFKFTTRTADWFGLKKYERSSQEPRKASNIISRELQEGRKD